MALKIAWLTSIGFEVSREYDFFELLVFKVDTIPKKVKEVKWTKTI